jgi:hypothetical protein
MRRPSWSPLAPFVVVMLLAAACGDPDSSNQPTVGSSTVAPTPTPTMSSSTVPSTPPSTLPPESSTTSQAVATTLAGGGWAEVPVITSPWGALGWWDGSAWVDAVEHPDADLTGRYRLLGLLGSDGATVDAVGETCHEGTGGIRPDPQLPWGEGDPFPTWSLALSAPWEVGSVATFEAGAEHVAAVSDFFASRGFEVEEPRVVQAIRADLFADGVPDAVIVAESIGDPVSLFPTAGDYSVVLILPDEDPEASPLVLGREVVVREPEGGDIPYTLRVPAIADLNGDGTLEVAVASAYYEGRGINIFAGSEGIRGLASVLVAACGA